MGETLSIRVRRRVAAIGAVVVAVAVPVAVAGQSSPAGAKASTSSTVPRTPDGHPDLQGVWFFATLTPLQRPDNLAGRTHITDAEVAEIEKRSAQRAANEPFGLFADYPKYAFDKRSSLIIDPPDGKIPARTPYGEKRQAERDAARHAAENPEDLPPYERCIVGYNSGPPILPGGYNENIQLVQTRDYLMLNSEMVHTARIIPLDGRPKLPERFRQWDGDSRGRWEGDTLVITSTNFRKEGTGTLVLDGNRARPGIGWSPDENAKLTERFKRLNSDILIYEVTVDDPTIWTKPWTMSLPMTRSDQHVYEYACHEGNYDMSHILEITRAVEKQGKPVK
jgi:hypothetical protein